MIIELCNEIEVLLPLKLESARMEKLTLTLSGNEWCFSVASAWRFTDSKKMIFGCYDDEVVQIVSEINQDRIIAVKVQSMNFPVDPVFIFSNGYRLEVFSARLQKPWIFQLPTGKVIVGSPGDRSWITGHDA